MASIKNLKKDIHNVLGDIIDAAMLKAEATGKDASKVIDEALESFDALIAKVYDKTIEDKKAHYNAISKELEETSNKLIEKINKF